MLRSSKIGLSLFFASLFVASAVTLRPAKVAHASLASNVPPASIVSLTIYLTLRNENEAEAEAETIQTPASASYHHFLSVAEFVSRYGAGANEIVDLKTALTGLGFAVRYVYPNHLALEAISTAANVQSVLGLTLKQVVQGGRLGITSTTPLRLPAALAGRVRAIAGFDTLSRRHSNHRFAVAKPRAASRDTSRGIVGGTPGDYLPADFEKLYDVTPLYKRGLTGRGSTIGIVTLNDFRSSDAYAFWKQIGLRVSPNRITKVNVDGGEAASTNSYDGESETDLDVEQSGSIAPDANVRVYIAPNVAADFINAFEAAASENVAATVSTSWGEPELDFFYNLATKSNGTGELEAFHDAFLEMALQGQTVFAASGDSGSFDTVADPCPVYGSPAPASPTCNAPYALDHPASDPLVTAAGGTTLPYTMTLYNLYGLRLAVAHERAWSWRYISDEAAAQGLAYALGVPDVFSTGDGGGVSSYWKLPWYQFGTTGTTVTKPGQTFVKNSGKGNVLQNVLPRAFRGRNVPDVSTDADPQTGYQYFEEGSMYDFSGGTSFVAPQLNGVNALLLQALGRVGQLNPALYELGRLGTNDLSRGDNWGYDSVPGYDNAVGLGTLDAAELLTGLEALRKK